MQKLKNKVTGEEYIITGSIGVPREIEENTFEVWTHFSVEVNVDGKIETIEVPPVDPEWEVIDIPDPEPEPTPEPEPEPTPEPVPPTAEQLATQQAFQAKMEFLTKLAEWDAQRVAGLFVTSRGGLISEADGLEFYQLEQWLLANWKKEYAVEAKQYLSALGLTA
jgi:hypothetical protein